MRLTALIEREDDGYVALCPEVDVASQGNSIEEARNNLTEALELFFENASPEEVFVTLSAPTSSVKPNGKKWNRWPGLFFKVFAASV
ncbi:MAG TPA: type II toxin-antitoxin system HicB family antitoxin [Candidatus Deferrimicrobium sp.]|nr:type II toxin-antitoxin system HicB family antitoxin [Candidatus Deferrimicrobium sp.]